MAYLPAIAAAGVALLAWLDAWRTLQLHAWRRHRESIVALQPAGNDFAFQLRAGAWHSGAILAGGLVTRWLTVVRLREEGEARRSRVLLLWIDSLGADDYRRLRVYLRWRWRDPKANAQIKA